MQETKRRGRQVVKDAFNSEMFEKMAKDLASGRIPRTEITITDDIVPGLRAIIRKSGDISFNVSYFTEDGSRPYLKIGEHPEMTIPKARKLAETIRSLADIGIDPQEGLRARLVRELDEQGTKWRPMRDAKAAKEEQAMEAAIAPLIEMGMERMQAIKTYRQLQREKLSKKTDN